MLTWGAENMASEAIAAVASAGTTVGKAAVAGVGAAGHLTGYAAGGAVGMAGRGVLGAGRGIGRTAARHPYITGTLGVGAAMSAGAGTIGVAVPVMASLDGARQIRNTLEAEHMSRLLINAQQGPFGTGDRPWGLGPNSNNSAGLSLAAHYATYRNKRLGALGLGLKYL